MVSARRGEYDDDDFDDVEGVRDEAWCDGYQVPLSMVWRYYYSCFQRFFKHMVMSAKVGVLSESEE